MLTMQLQPSSNVYTSLSDIRVFISVLPDVWRNLYVLAHNERSEILVCHARLLTDSFYCCFIIGLNIYSELFIICHFSQHVSTEDSISLAGLHVVCCLIYIR